MTPSTLELLASRCGIGLTTTDGHGRSRPVSRETLVAILRALGVAADTDDEVQASLGSLERQRWQTALAPVTVAREAAVAVEVTLPGATRLLSWRLALEDGTQRTGGARFGDLPLVARDDGDVRAGRRKECRRLALGTVPLGHHRVTIEPHDSVTTLIVTPAGCHLPDTARRYWGAALQLYLLRSQRNFGIGDFSDLAALAVPLARRGCDVIGLNPLHAPFPDDPEHASPYSPASRLLLNPLNIDLGSLPEVQSSPRATAFLASDATAREIERCRGADILEYKPVAALKQRVLELAFADWISAGAEQRELAKFRAERGTTFERHCLYFALRAHMLAEGLAPGDWHRWPQPYQDSRAAVVARFAGTHADAVTFFAWQQWLADRQLAAAATAAGSMSVGLYRDLAVGSDASGAETWAERELVLDGLSIGAPPDALSASGQDWGLPPPHPQKMRAGAYRNFIELTRANMRHAGALRIDHVMGLARLFVIPHGLPATEGAYLEYPFEELLGVLALESARARCVIIGEDLGTVPPGFRERLAAAQILSYRVVRFENEWGSNRPIKPQHYPPLSVAVFGNHDLPTLRGWWDGTDIDLEREYGGAHGDEAEARRRREADKEALLALLREQGLLTDPSSFEELAVAVHRLLGRTQSLLSVAQLDDMLAEREPVNSPSARRYPNWRRRHSVPLEDLVSVPLFERIAAALATERPSAQPPS
jgi:4-alpha-glucanotransferase